MNAAHANGTHGAIRRFGSSPTRLALPARAIMWAKTNSTSGRQPVHVVEGVLERAPAARPCPVNSSTMPRIAWSPAITCADGEPEPVALAGAAPADRGAESPDPPNGEDDDDGEPDDLGGPPARAESTSRRHPRSAPPPAPRDPCSAVATGAGLRGRTRAALAATPGLSSLTSEPLQQLREPGQIVELREDLGGRHAVRRLGCEPGPVEPRQQRLEVEARQTATEDLEDGACAWRARRSRPRVPPRSCRTRPGPATRPRRPAGRSPAARLRARR